MLNGTHRGQTIVPHVNDTGNGVADGSLTQHTYQVDTDINGEIQDILRVDIQLKSAANGVDHFIFGENRIGCGQLHRALIGKFHCGKLLSFVKSAQRRT